MHVYLNICTIRWSSDLFSLYFCNLLTNLLNYIILLTLYCTISLMIFELCEIKNHMTTSTYAIRKIILTSNEPDYELHVKKL